MIKLVKLITFLIILFAVASCGSRSGGIDKTSQAKEFGDFLDLFPDVGQSLANDEEIIFPLNGQAYDSLIRKLPDSIPTRFKKYIHMEDSAFLFYGSTMAQFGEGRPYYPIYKIQADAFSVVVVYYTVPEVPRNRVMGEHYLIFTYTPQGDLIDAYALAFNGTYAWRESTPESRYARFYQLNNIKVTTTRAKESNAPDEFVHEIQITPAGEIKETPERPHFNDYGGTWVLAEQNGPVKALKECDQWMETLNIRTNDAGEPTFEHFTGQMTTVYRVEKFTTNPDDDRVRFSIVDPTGDTRGAGSFYYADPEHITIKIKGHNLYAGETTEALFVKKASVDNGSIEIMALPCQEEQ
jgi:hypothetical protein